MSQFAAWMGAGAMLLGVAATMYLVYRWSRRNASLDWKWNSALRSAALVSLPMGLGMALGAVLVFASLGELDSTVFAFALAALPALSFLATALIYLPYFHWASRRGNRSNTPG